MNDTALNEIDAARNARVTNPNEWVELYGDYLYNFAMGQVRNAVEAEDLVQETFLAALKSRGRFNGQSSERTWLVGILRHKICDRLRSKCRTPQVAWFGQTRRDREEEIDESLAWLHETAEECIGPDRWIDLAEFRAALDQALGKLPTRIAQVFEMYEINERSGREVCRAMNISESNLWVMLHRARTQLRQQLQPTWGHVAHDSAAASVPVESSSC